MNLDKNISIYSTEQIMSFFNYLLENIDVTGETLQVIRCVFCAREGLGGSVSYKKCR